MPLDDAAGQARELNDGPRDLPRQQNASDEREHGSGQGVQVKSPADGGELAEVDVDPEVHVQRGDGLAG